MDNLNSTLENKLVIRFWPLSAPSPPPVPTVSGQARYHSASPKSWQANTPFQPDGHFIVQCFWACCSCLFHDASARLSASWSLDGFSRIYEWFCVSLASPLSVTCISPDSRISSHTWSRHSTIHKPWAEYCFFYSSCQSTRICFDFELCAHLMLRWHSLRHSC